MMQCLAFCIQCIFFMIYMHVMQFSALDLNLLRVFAAVYEHRSVEEAARHLALSPSATSHALRRLRTALDDPLFTRGGEGMTPTPFGLRIGAAVRAHLHALQTTLVGEAAPALETLALTWRILGNDYAEALVLPALSRELARVAPKVDVHVLPEGSSGRDRLRDGQADIGLGVFDQDVPGYHHQVLFEERFVCLVAQGHPCAARRWTLKDYVSYPHLLVAPRGKPGGVIDQALAALQLKRRIARTVSAFLTAPYLLEGSNYVLTIGERVARLACGRLPVVVKPLPLALPGFCLAMLWHDRTHGDPAARALRTAAACAARSL